MVTKGLICQKQNLNVNNSIKWIDLFEPTTRNNWQAGRQGNKTHEATLKLKL